MERALEASGWINTFINRPQQEIRGELGMWLKAPMRAVTFELPGANVKTLDVRKIVRDLAESGVNVISAFAVTYWPGGAAYYQSRIAPKHPDLGNRDLLMEVVEEAHKHGIKVIAYVNCLWGGRELFEKHPDWAQRRVDGKPTSWEPTHTSVAMCPNSPYREYFLRVVEEIAENYDIDGFYFDEPSFQSWCNCVNCKRLFKEQFGEELPVKASWSDPLWQTFIQWRYNCITDFKRALYEKSKEKKDLVVFFQHPFPLSFFSQKLILALAEVLEKAQALSVRDVTSGLVAKMEDTAETVTRYVLETANWYIPKIYGAELLDVARFEDVIHMELYRRVVDRPIWWYGVCARLGRSAGQGKPILILNMQGYYPFDLYSLPDSELRLATGEIVANNAQPLFAMYYPDVADKRGWKTVAQCYKKLKECEEYLTELQSVKFAAVLYSRKTINRFDSDAERARHVNSLMGICKALLQEHILFDVITEKQLEDGLKEYKVLILPNVRCMNEREKQIVKSFVEKGGGLIASYETSLYNEGGGMQSELGLGEVFGASYLGQEKLILSYDSYMQIKKIHPVTRHLTEPMLIPSTGTQPMVKTLNGAETLATLIEEPPVHYAPLGEDTGIPTIIANEYGKGRVVYFPGAIGDMYLKFGVLDHQKFIAQAVKWVADGEQTVMVENCPSTIELTAYEQVRGNRFVVHLMNSIRGEVEEPIIHACCERDIQVGVQVPSEGSDYRVKVVYPEVEELPYEREKGRISFKVPKLKIHKIVALERVRR